MHSAKHYSLCSSNGDTIALHQINRCYDHWNQGHHDKPGKRHCFHLAGHGLNENKVIYIYIKQNNQIVLTHICLLMIFVANAICSIKLQDMIQNEQEPVGYNWLIKALYYIPIWYSNNCNSSPCQHHLQTRWNHILSILYIYITQTVNDTCLM